MGVAARVPTAGLSSRIDRRAAPGRTCGSPHHSQLRACRRLVPTLRSAGQVLCGHHIQVCLGVDVACPPPSATVQCAGSIESIPISPRLVRIRLAAFSRLFGSSCEQRPRAACQLDVWTGSIRSTAPSTASTVRYKSPSGPCLTSRMRRLSSDSIVQSPPRCGSPSRLKTMRCS